MTYSDTKALTRGAAEPPWENAGTEHRRTSATPSDPSSFTIDVGRQVAEIENVLRVGEDLTQCIEGLAVLERWQFDEMLDDASRKRARLLVQTFGAGGLPLSARR